jgi:hypothetical protein
MSSSLNVRAAVRQNLSDLVVPLFVVPIEQVQTIEVGLDKLPRPCAYAMRSDQRERGADTCQTVLLMQFYGDELAVR